MREYLNIPKQCPVCGGETKIIISDSGTKTLICTNSSCSGKLINILDHYCGVKGLDIKGLSKMTLEKLIDWGWITKIEDLYYLKNHATEWINKPGFGEKSVSKILDAIENSKNCELWRFISALGIPLIGSTVAKDLANKYKNWETFKETVDSKYNFSKLPNFGYEMEKSILGFDWSKADDIITIGKLTFLPTREQEEKKKNLNGLTIVITGKLQMGSRDKMKAVIEAHGGKVAGSISSKTSYLINNDPSSKTAKNKAAMAAGIPILTEAEFIKKFLD